MFVGWGKLQSYKKNWFDLEKVVQTGKGFVGISSFFLGGGGEGRFFNEKSLQSLHAFKLVIGLPNSIISIVFRVLWNKLCRSYHIRICKRIELKF